MTDAFDPELARSAVALVLEGQEPPFEGRVGARMDDARWFDSADELFEAGMDYLDRSPGVRPVERAGYDGLVRRLVAELALRATPRRGAP